MKPSFSPPRSAPENGGARATRDEVVVVLRPGQTLRVVYAEPERTSAPAQSEPRGLTLEELAPLARLSVRSLRGLIARGKLPARLLGRSYVVEREDAERLLRPQVRTVETKPKEPKTEGGRIARQLAAAGIRVK